MCGQRNDGKRPFVTVIPCSSGLAAADVDDDVDFRFRLVIADRVDLIVAAVVVVSVCCGARPADLPLRRSAGGGGGGGVDGVRARFD